MHILNPLLTSYPSALWPTFLELWSQGNLAHHILTTLSATLVGFTLSMVIGIIVAAALWWSDFLYKVLDPARQPARAGQAGPGLAHHFHAGQQRIARQVGILAHAGQDERVAVLVAHSWFPIDRKGLPAGTVIPAAAGYSPRARGRRTQTRTAARCGPVHGRCRETWAACSRPTAPCR